MRGVRTSIEEKIFEDNRLKCTTYWGYVFSH